MAAAAPQVAATLPEDLAAKAENDEAERRRVLANVLNMRSGPSSRFPVIGRLTGGERAVLTGETRRGWVHVRAEDGSSEGWVYGKYLARGDA